MFYIWDDLSIVEMDIETHRSMLWDQHDFVHKREEWQYLQPEPFENPFQTKHKKS